MKYLIFVAALIVAVQSQFKSDQRHMKITIDDIPVEDAARLIKELEQRASNVHINVHHADQSVVAAAEEGAEAVKAKKDESVKTVEVDDHIAKIQKMKQMLGTLLKQKKDDQVRKIKEIQRKMKRDNLMVKITHNLKENKDDNKENRHKEIEMLKTLKQEKLDAQQNEYKIELRELKQAERRDALIEKIAHKIKHDQQMHGQHDDQESA